MQSAIGSALRTVISPIGRPACRVVGSTRYPLSRRTFHRSAISCRLPDNQGGRDAEDNGIVPEASKQTEGDNVEGDVASSSSSLADAETSPVARTGRQAKSRLRGNRQRQPEGLPPVVLPDWFWERNVKRVEDPPRCGFVTVFGGLAMTLEKHNVTLVLKEGHDDLDSCVSAVPAAKDAKYTIHIDVYNEIMSTLKAGLILRPPRVEKTIRRPVTLLHCPKDGGIYYLDSVMESMAERLGADLVRLDAQDIAQIIGPYVDENLAWTDSETSYLGYSAQKAAGKLQEYHRDDHESNESGGEDIGKFMKQYRDMNMDRRDEERHSLDKENHIAGPGSRRSPLSRIPGLPVVGIFGIGSDVTTQKSPKSGPEPWHGLKVSTALDAIIGAADAKRAASTESESTENRGAGRPRKYLIIQVKGYNDLSETKAGPALLRALRSAVDKRWQEGRNIVLVGTASSDDLGLSKNDIQHVQLQDAESETRTIIVPPERKEEQDIAFNSDEKARIRQINVRHIEDMIMKLNAGRQTSNSVIDVESNLDSSTAYASGLEADVWTYARVRRLATIVLGLDPPPARLDGHAVTVALKLLNGSDEVKFDWGAAELQKEEAEANAMMQDGDKPTGDRDQDKLNKIRKKCSNHEKRLLSGVNLPAEISTGFSDVHAPEETIEALQTLTSLSLLRPDAFSYGVLATNKIPGLLIYGPPGTGKTLLAKAVAKESGAIVLEVSGASINDMYVGEGEKNVKAIFTLAKKLSPCVVFIDEADALLAARGGGSKRSVTHREIINQFLREWDGMNDHSAFIMVATNRPYDLDEAVLRRLPRRLLVDLPLEKDRASILSLHLKDETLDASVSIPDIAKNTPYYSGSDLKNVCVAAALACLREENAAAAAHTGSEPYEFPKTRVLAKRHFDKALDEISASISKDMTTLKAIRKFDEKYGDRKGRREKTAALGFGGTAVEERDSEAGRVRKAEA